jgi:hypothetical protein
MKKSANSAQGRRGPILSSASLGGALALALFALPQIAHADNECGVAPATPVTVTCTAAGNPYPNGVTYIAPPADLIIVLQDGVRINTGGSLNIGVLAVGDQALTVNGASNTIITTTDDGAFGVLVANNTDAATVRVDRVVTSGVNATGVLVSSSEGAVTIGANNIATSGNRADGINGSTDISAITINSGTITTSGQNATGIDANSDFGSIVINSSAITTTGASSGGFGAGSLGILAQTGGIGTVTINSGSISTAGADAVGIRAFRSPPARSPRPGLTPTPSTSPAAAWRP